jgi:general secretion pathway protein D
VRWGTLALLAVAFSACATGKAISRAESAAKKGDWDSAVAYYREALGRDPKRLDVRLSLERAMREASSIHLKRARDLEAQDQLPGAAAEYRLAASLDPANAFALSKALEIERVLREKAEANRPLSRMEEMRQQAAQASVVPRLDPRTRVNMSFPRSSVQSILQAISELAGIQITYDANLLPQLQNPYTVSFTDTPLEEALTTVMGANTLAYKITGPKAIFVYQDSQTNRQRYEDQFFKMFYISHGDPQEMVAILNLMLQQGPVIRPVIQPVKTANALSVRATAPVMDLIEKMIASIDKPRAEVIIEVEILEVDRTRAKQLGIDLSRYALGFTFSPEVPPSNTPQQGFPPVEPPPFNLNTITGGVSTNDFYVSVPTMQIKLLESDQKTRLLAHPQLRGREGFPMQLNLGDSIPIIQTQLLPSAAGGVPTLPQQQIQYRDIGVNLNLTPRVTYQDEIILEQMSIDKSGIGATVNVGGADYQSFVTRRATVNLRLRDGESSLLAGLIREEDRKSWTSLPGILHLPILRSIFGSASSNFDQSDIVMIVTPHIIRSHDLTVSDLRALPLGSNQNFGVGGVPQLISAGTPPAAETLPLPGGQPPAAVTGGGQPPVTGVPPPQPPPTTPPPATGTTGGTGTGSRAVGVVPVTPVSPTPETRPQSGQAQIAVSTPGTEFALTGGPYPVPIQIANAAQVGTIALTISYNPAVLRATTVTQGTFMQQGGATTTFTPKIDATAGRVEIAISRAGESGATATTPGLIGAIMFQPVAAGNSQITVTAVLTTPTGQSIPVATGPANVVVK